MKTFIVDLLSRLKIFSVKENVSNKIINNHWVALGDINTVKRVFIFRDNGVLLISENGRVQRSTWQYLNDKSLIVDIESQGYLLKIDFIDDCIIALKIDGQNGHAFFINETVHGTEINNSAEVIEYLKTKYFPKLLENEIRPKLDELRVYMKNVKNSILYADQGDLDIIVQIIKHHINSIESADVFMNLYYQRFGSDLITDLSTISTLKKDISYLLSPFIDLNIVDQDFPHNRLI